MVTMVVRVGRVAYEYGRKNNKWVMLRILCGFILGLVMFISPTYAMSWETIPTNKIVDAIYVAEGGSKTKHPFGVLSVKCNGYTACRKICTNTVNNNKKRFAKQTKYKDFIAFLGSKYCPVGANNDPRGLNKNWVKNVKLILVK